MDRSYEKQLSNNLTRNKTFVFCNYLSIQNFQRCVCLHQKYLILVFTQKVHIRIFCCLYVEVSNYSNKLPIFLCFL